MSIKSKLQPGEQVIFRINRGRKWYHYLLLILPWVVLSPIVLWMMGYFLFPLLEALVPREVIMLIRSSLLILIGLGLLVDILHFWLDKLVLTDRRIIGLVMGARSGWVFRGIDVPLSVIQSATARSSTRLVIQRKDGRPNLIVKNLRESRQFAAKLVESISSTR